MKSAAGVFAFAVIASGCITQNVQLPTGGNSPPSIETSPTANYRANGINRLDVGDGGTGVGGTGVVTISLVVRDPDVRSILESRVFINYTGVQSVPAWDEPIGPAPGFTTERPVMIGLASANLTEDHCHRVEVLVSSRFVSENSREPVTPGDLGTLTLWFVRGDTTVEECAGRGP